MDQLLWIETLVKGLAGLGLFLAPTTIIRAFALPASLTPFWPRLLGSLLLAIAVVTFLTGAKLLNDGLGLGALAIFNLIACTFLGGHLFFARAEQARRARALMTLVTITLGALAVAELVVR